MKPTLPAFLTGDLGAVYTGPSWVALSRLDTIPDLILDPRRFFLQVNTFKKLEILTYTYSYMPRTLVSRLVVGPPQLKPEGWVALPNRDNCRTHPQLHTKLYLCYSSVRATKPCGAYLGSQNQTAPTTYNIMVSITNRAKLSALLSYFNLIWSEAKPLCKKSPFLTPQS